MRSQLDDLQRQLGTGKKSDTYAGLGLDRGLTVGLRSQLSAISRLPGHHHPGRRAARPDADRADAVQQRRRSRPRARSCNRSTRSTAPARPQDQTNATGHARPAARHAQHRGRRPLPVLRPRRRSAAGRHRPITSSTATALKAGLKQVIDERRQADLGASGLGRLAVGAPAATGVASPRMRVSPFGFKLVGATTTIARRHRHAAGRRAAVDVGRSRRRPIRTPATPSSSRFTLPDGTSRDLTLTATTSATPGPGQFTIGANSTATAANLQAALHPGPRHAGQHRAGRRRPRSPPATISSTPTPPIRRSGSTARRSTPRPRWSTAPPPTPWLVHRRQRHRRSALDRARPRRPVADRGLWRARQRAGAAHGGAEPRGVRGECSSRGSDPNGQAQYAALQAAHRRGSRRRAQPAEGVRHRGPARRRPGRAQQRQGPPRPDQHDAAEPAAERRGRADRAGRGADPGAADEPAGHAADHGDAAADQLSSICRRR